MSKDRPENLPENLLDILRSAVGQYPEFNRRLDEADVLRRWNDIVGPVISRNARAVAFRNEILLIEVKESAWRAELQYRKTQILEMINQDRKLVKDLQFYDPKPRPGRYRFKPKSSESK
jgi:predicted nucleic acid-binding Zn ribbon protein